MGADPKKAGVSGIASLFVGIVLSFVVGVLIADDRS